MKIVLLSGTFAAMLITSPSFAGINEVNTCAQKLPEVAQKILNAVSPKIKPGVDARKVMETTVISMVRSGEIDRSNARSNAQAAGECLKKWQD